ncbi:uncharacterized protein LOC117341480 isoform X3 [Pecten maximus]|uniref:uncharacterized protein LOC117341480 isoform X3 n=1 Tax=Pecten maximus TaxID=6579 RepID=UPI00145885EF|nr:uncharacterized protein LOC117341480 isoform X3 [Pecten maximus]
MKMLPALVVILLNAMYVTPLTYPTVVEAELGKSYVMTFTFDPIISSLSQFHITDVTTSAALVIVDYNTTSVNQDWERRANVENNIANGNVTVTLTTVLVEDEGWYRVTMDTGHSEQSGRFPIVTYAQPISLTLTQTEVEDEDERYIRCTGNVGRPNPVLRLLQSPPYNDVTNHEIMKYKPTTPLQNGTFLVDHFFNVTFPFSDNGTHVVCDVIHEIALGTQLRPIRSKLDLVIVAQPVVSGQSITITGPSTLETPTSELRLTCTPSSAGITDVNVISLLKNSSSTDYQTVVSVRYSKATSSSVLTWGNVVSQSRAGVTATGNVDTLSGAQLVFTIATNRTNCNDGGAYQCNMGVTLAGGSGGVATDEKYITAKVQPISTNDMTVFPFPNVESVYYSVGSSLTFTCTGTVGSDKKPHTWCYKRATDQGYTGYPTASDINQNDNGLIQSGCNYQRTSTLTYNVTNEDTNTTFMCEPFTGTVCGSNPASLITYKSIRRYSSGGTTGGQGDAGGTGGDTASAGTIAGIVIGVFAGILLIILIVYFVVFRRRSPGETYNTKEDGSPEGPAHTEGPVYSVPDKNRTRGKHGHDNNAMDEPREEKRQRRRHRDHRDRDDYDDGRGHANKVYDNYSDQDGDIGGSVDGGHPVGIGSAV